jgi:hypothetical protein
LYGDGAAREQFRGLGWRELSVRFETAFRNYVCEGAFEEMASWPWKAEQSAGAARALQSQTAEGKLSADG